MGGRHFWCAFGCALTFLASQNLRAQEEEDEPHLPGLIASYSQSGTRPIERIEPTVARHGPLPDERLVPGKPYSVTWRGVLIIPDDGSYQLHVHGSGNVQVKLAGKSLLQQDNFHNWLSSAAQQLKFGPVPIEITYKPDDFPAMFALFWSSDRFEREPVPARALAHDRAKTISPDFNRGHVLSRALRCEACHTPATKSAEPLPAPALDQLAGNLNRNWLINWLRDDGSQYAFGNIEKPARRMPLLNLPEDEARLLAAWLLSGEPKPLQPEAPAKESKAKKRTNAELHDAGQTLVRTKGCLACHALGENRDGGLFGGGDLNYVAAKRPREFFAAWLQKPESLNRDHRMPVFDLTADERDALAFYLSMLGKAPSAAAGGPLNEVDRVKARALAKKHRCDQCHRLPDAAEVAKLAAPRAVAPLTAKSNWQKTCVVESFKEPRSQPVLWFSNKDGQALQTYYSQRATRTADQIAKPDGAQLILENNCLACHAREPQLLGILPQKLSDKLVRLAEEFPELASQLPALTPPSLNSVGDKLADTALTNAITRAGPPHRPYLQVQMPRFRLSKEQTATLAGHFIDIDRIPDYERKAVPEPTPAQQAARTLAGKRLVGTDGFSCTACHQVGSVQPVKAPPNARGPTLSMMQDRLRKTWFDRWVRNPARIIPRMEMPSVQIPVRGVLQDNLSEQLAAVWQTLNTPGFEPPLPEPVRTLRFYSSEDNKNKHPLVITDLIEHDGQTLERAALIGLPNRHNLLFDFATNRLLAWSHGDLARQRTKGKNWYWEPAGSPLLSPGIQQSEFACEVNDVMWEAVPTGQWLADLQYWNLAWDIPQFKYQVRLQATKPVPGSLTAIDVHVTEYIEPRLDPDNGFDRRINLGPFPHGAKIYWRLLDADRLGVKPSAVKADENGLTVSLANRGEIRLTHQYRQKKKCVWLPAGTVVFEPEQGGLSCTISYTSTLPRDEYHAPRPPAIPYDQPPVVIAPGFAGQRLALPSEMMPTALAWRPNGDLIVASLKGQVQAFTAKSLQQPQLEGELLAEGLAAPYGLQAGDDYVDVIAKHSLVRVMKHPEFHSTEFFTAASGWGYTSDYHDWAVGLPRDAKGNYYVALPCFQDNRAEPAKRLRGSVLKLTPRKTAFYEMPKFDIEVLTHGHRFPMGMALNAKDELFVTDNQGNYNPFNELNFVEQGKHFGFVNKGEKAPAEHTPPNIAIPHPWTRSVNGICFLKSPQGSMKNTFGQLEGHLIGCEYDTRRLIRMSLQKVGDDYQGCCYPLTVPSQPEESPLGPICCEVSPAGELFIGSIRDSGWGAGNNIGEVIRVKVDPAKFGHGLAEMRATATGFELDFFSPVEKELAEQLENYSLSSYRRESTPAYGGNDMDRRTEKLAKVAVSADRRRVTLTLDTLRAGHVYELRLKSLAPAGELFFPAEAHYTLRQLVK